MLSIFTIPGLQNSSGANPGNIDSNNWVQFYNTTINFFKNFNFHIIIADIKLAAIILTIIFGAIFVIVLRKIWRLGIIKKELAELKNEFNPPAGTKTAYDNRWQEIRSHVESFIEAEWKLAVIEGDKFVDDVLKAAGFAGESMGERLMLIKPDQIVNLQHLWDAHKLRNLLVHDPNFRLTHQQATLAINAFESVLKELSAIN